MPLFTKEDRDLLAPYVTSTDEDIFAVHLLNNIVGAVYARYSRAPGGFRETLLKEFLKEGIVDAAHAGELIERVLIAFGDDSVGELEGAHVSFENITMLATKEIEDRRIGGSPIEQSTRYVAYDMKGDDGNHRYYRDPAIISSPHAQAYVETMDFIFETYGSLIGPMKEWYRKMKPLDDAEYDVLGTGTKQRYADLAEEKDRKAFRQTYNMDIRTKACDTLRYLLPLATKTNVGVFGNGRYFQGLLTYCYSSDFPESQEMAKKAHEALNHEIPRYVKRAHRSDYIVNTRRAMQKLADRILKGIEPEDAEEVTLQDRGEEHLASVLQSHPGDGWALRLAMENEETSNTIAHMLYAYARHPLAQLRKLARDMRPEQRDEVIRTYVGERRTRRDRPGRALEAGYPLTYDIVSDYGTFKDLERHRMTTQIRQRFTPMLGFCMPPDLEAAGFADKARECHERAKALYALLAPDFPEQASYATLHGCKVRWVMGMNERSGMHLMELRTIPQGHPSYRKVAQLMHAALRKRSGWRADAMRFVDYNDYLWARADSEARQRVKERELDKEKG